MLENTTYRKPVSGHLPYLVQVVVAADAILGNLQELELLPPGPGHPGPSEAPLEPGEKVGLPVDAVHQRRYAVLQPGVPAHADLGQLLCLAWGEALWGGKGSGGSYGCLGEGPMAATGEGPMTA
jgi:hypothetical protein